MENKIRFLGRFSLMVFCCLAALGPSTPAFAYTETIYEDAEDGDTLGWSIFDQTPSGASISNIYDSDRTSRVIALSGSGIDNGYELRSEDGSPWDDATQFFIAWRMKCSGNVQVYVDVETTGGRYYLYYDPTDTDNLAIGQFIQHGLGSDIIDGQWHAFARDLDADLKDAFPGLSISQVDGLYIRGSMRIDDIKLFTALPLLKINNVALSEDAGAALFSITASATAGADITVDYTTGDIAAEAGYDYVTSSGTATISTGSTSVNVSVTIIDDSDLEGDEAFSVLLTNALNAAISDDMGLGIILDNDPSPGYTVYEDAANGNTLGWTVFDNTPAGASISNVYDVARGSRVIALSGSGTDNGYEFRSEDGTPWDNSSQSMIEWSMKCSGNVQVYVDVETTGGRYYLYYTPIDSDNLGTGQFIHHGLGSNACDGQWRSFVRGLLSDLRDAQPTLSITQVDGIYVRGSVRVDDIRLFQPLLNINDVTVDEDAGAALFTITASTTRGSDITVDFNTSDITAEAGYDYVFSSGTATIAAGSSSVDLSVTILDDSDYEGDELFSMVLSNATNAYILDDTGDATIIDDEVTVYEDAEDGDTLGWSVIDNTPPGASISNVYDSDKGSRVIVLSGADTDNGYEFRSEDGSDWDNSSQFFIKWSMKCSGGVQVYVDLETTAGRRYLYYTPVDYDSLGTGQFIHYGLGSDACDGQWRTFIRDLVADLHNAQPGIDILEVDSLQVDGLYIRGSASFDDIELYSELPLLLSVNDITVDEAVGSAVFTISASETNNSPITVDYATHDGLAEAGYDYVMSSGTATIGIGSAFVNVSISIIDDTEFEGDEQFYLLLNNPNVGVISGGVGEAIISANDLPDGYTVYENAEDGDTLGWSIFDNLPAGATISNLYDSDRGSRVIAVSGTGTNNGYELRNEDDTPWDNATQTGCQWAMKCSEEVQIFLDVETTGGRYYLYYTPIDDDLLGTGAFIHHGLGSDIMDGTYHTFQRDLEADLKDAQSSLSITEVDGMYILGSLSIDDVILY